MSLPTEEFTIGVEEEYQIIDPLTRELRPDAGLVLAQARGVLGEMVQHELVLSEIEAATPVCRTLAEVQSALIHLRGGLMHAANDIGRRIAAAGTHPFSDWQEQPVTPKERYHQLVGIYQQHIRQQIIFGCHVHIGIKDREMAAQVLNHVRVWLAPLLALTANSPFWQGHDTGYASYRSGLWWNLPLSGPPPHFSSATAYDAFVQQCISTRSIEDASRIYWDVRLSQRFETIEFRVMDVCMLVDEAVLIAGLIRALVQQCYTDIMRKVPFPAVSVELLRTAIWRAARYGLDGDLVDGMTMQLVPARTLFESLLDFVRPALEAQGDWQQVSSLLTSVLQRGNGANRQRQILAQTGSLEAVVDFVSAETCSF